MAAAASLWIFASTKLYCVTCQKTVILSGYEDGCIYGSFRSDGEDENSPRPCQDTLRFHWCSSGKRELLLVFWLISTTTCIIQPVFRGAEWFLKIGSAAKRCANPVRVLHDLCGNRLPWLSEVRLVLPRLSKIDSRIVSWHFLNAGCF
jgi:hypothetical protein